MTHGATLPYVSRQLTRRASIAGLLPQVVLKSQILAGGRGLGKFTNGLQGGVHICSVPKAKELAAKMLGQTLVTKQTGKRCRAK